MKHFILLIIISISFAGCSKRDIKTDTNCVSCEEKNTFKILINEPAHVRIQCTEPITFSFELDNQYDGINGIVPCNEIPLKYRIDGKSVLISGTIYSCLVAVCATPDTRRLPFNVFELTTIKTNIL
ncbi:MAG: hypothetical protein LBF90_02970 [Prevotellaceae bacterium]|jgi:hypothetical protein|nr:hypothetical protein [Prevotellaceae bacterium]